MQESEKAKEYMDVLCGVKLNRRTGSPGNREATAFFNAMVKKWNYEVDTTPFPCLDYESRKASLIYQNQAYDIHISPFSLGCDVTSEMVTVTTVSDLENSYCRDKILLMRGEICAEQLMPKNFVFYNPDHHKRIYALLEERQPAAIVAATEKNPELVGALYPFPLIEDGDFNIPSAYCTDTVGKEIAVNTGKVFRLATEAKRIPSTACNVIARKNYHASRKIVVTAHIDAYWSTPGALDNASGTVVLLLLAEMLEEHNGNLAIEIIAFNGEDYYSALAVNLDDLGYKHGGTAYSLYQCPSEIDQKARNIFGRYSDMARGEPWYQGDHMIFVQKGKPAISMTSEKMPDLMASITHTPKDTPDMVDCEKLVEAASALRDFIQAF
ncbi:MAG: M28 family peptidase [Dehalogenimonas sp.]